MQNNHGVLVFCAHPDDHIIGAGGTIAKYSDDGKKVIVVIASKGEKGVPWLKEDVTKRIRTRETSKVTKIISEYKNLNLGLREGNFSKELKKPKVEKLLRKLIKTYRINKIFTHSIDDPLPDHRAIVNFAMELTKSMKSIEVFSFNVWNPFIIRKTMAPKMYVDISKTFSRKAEALRMFKSQRHVVVLWGGFVPYWIGAVLAGLRNKTKYAEVFLKLK